MNRGILLTAMLLASLQAQAHVSDAQGLAHAHEHLWLMLLLLPILGLARPALRAVGRLKRQR